MFSNFISLLPSITDPAWTQSESCDTTHQPVPIGQRNYTPTLALYMHTGPNHELYRDLLTNYYCTVAVADPGNRKGGCQSIEREARGFKSVQSTKS